MSTEITAFTMSVRELDQEQATAVSTAFKEDDSAQHCFWDTPFTDPQAVIKWSTTPDVVLLSEYTTKEIIGLSWQFSDEETTTSMKGLFVWIFSEARSRQPGLSAALIHAAQDESDTGIEVTILDTVMPIRKSGQDKLHASASIPVAAPNTDLGSSGIRHY